MAVSEHLDIEYRMYRYLHLKRLLEAKEACFWLRNEEVPEIIVSKLKSASDIMEHCITLQDKLWQYWPPGCKSTPEKKKAFELARKTERLVDDMLSGLEEETNEFKFNTNPIFSVVDDLSLATFLFKRTMKQNKVSLTREQAVEDGKRRKKTSIAPGEGGKINHGSRTSPEEAKISKDGSRKAPEEDGRRKIIPVREKKKLTVVRMNTKENYKSVLTADKGLLKEGDTTQLTIGKNAPDEGEKCKVLSVKIRPEEESTFKMTTLENSNGEAVQRKVIVAKIAHVVGNDFKVTVPKGFVKTTDKSKITIADSLSVEGEKREIDDDTSVSKENGFSEIASGTTCTMEGVQKVISKKKTRKSSQKSKSKGRKSK